MDEDSLFPKSASKFSLLTPIRRRDVDKAYSFSDAGLSTSSRKLSSFYRPSYAGTKTAKDTRSFYDKDTQNIMMKQLETFLNEKGYPFPVTEAVRNLNRRNFTQIFEFMVRQMDPTYVFKEKFEDAVPKFFRSMGYGVPIKTSTMQTIGASHTTPYLLAALCWLSDCVDMTEKVTCQDILLSKEEGDGQRIPLTYAFFTNCFRKHRAEGGDLSHAGKYDLQIQHLIQTCKEKMDIGPQMVELEAQEKVYSEKLKEILENEDVMEQKKQEIEVQSNDLAKLYDFNEELLENIAQLNRKKRENEDKINELNEGISDIRRQIASNESIVAKQEITPEEARRLLMKCDDLRRNCNELPQRISSVESDCVEICELMKQKNFELQDKCSKFLGLIEQMKSHFDFGLCERNTEDGEVQSENGLLSVLQSAEKQVNNLEQEIAEMLAQIDAKCMVIQESNKDLKVKRQCLIEELNVIRKQSHDEARQHSLQMEELLNELSSAKLDVDIAENELRAIENMKTKTMGDDGDIANVRKEIQEESLVLMEVQRIVINQTVTKLEKMVENFETLKALNMCLQQCKRDILSAVQSAKPCSDEKNELNMPAAE